MKKKGFTLIEVIIAVSIFLIVSIAVVNQINQGRLLGVMNKKKIDTEVCAQYIIQTYKGSGKNYVKSLVNNSNKRIVYFYFDNSKELGEILDKERYVDGTYEELISNKDNVNKRYGAFMELDILEILGQDESGNDVKVTDGINHARVYVKVIDLSNIERNQSSLVFYLGR